MESPLRQLTQGHQQPVLVFDFLPFAAVRPLADVVARHNAGHPVFRADPVGDLTSATAYHGMAALADGYAKTYADTSAFAGRYPLIVGYCSAAILAIRVAERVGGSPEVVLVQPSWPTESQVRADFAAFLGQWSGQAEATARLDGLAAEELLDRMTAELEREVHGGAAERGLDTEAGRELVRDLLDRYRAWLAFLLASAENIGTGSASPLSSLHLLGGSDDPLVLPWPQPGEPRTVRLPSGGNDLLDSPAQLTAAILSTVLR